MGKMNKQFFIGKWRVARMTVRGKKRNEAVTGGCSTWNLWLLNGGVGAEGESGCRIGKRVLKVEVKVNRGVGVESGSGC